MQRILETNDFLDINLWHTMASNTEFVAER